MKAKLVGQVSMAEQKVGTLNRTYENSLVVENGAVLVSTGSNDFNETENFFSLIKNLKRGRIDGFLIDKYTYRSFKENLLLMIKNEEIVKFFLSGTIITDVQHRGEDLSYGVLIKFKKRYDYFKPMFESNKLAFHATIMQYLNNGARNSTSQNEDELKTETFDYAALRDLELAYFLIPLGIIVLFGMLFEILRNYRMRNVPENML